MTTRELSDHIYAEARRHYDQTGRPAADFYPYALGSAHYSLAAVISDLERALEPGDMRRVNAALAALKDRHGL